MLVLIQKGVVMSINSINLSQARENLKTLSLLTKEENKNSKLCFSPDGKDVAIESSSGLFRTAKSLGSLAAYYLTKNSGGWSRELNSLNPLIEKTVNALNIDLHPQEIIIIANETRQAIEGLVALVNNHYQEVTEKAAIVNAAIESLKEAYHKFDLHYGAKDMIASTQLTENARKNFEHLENGYIAQVELLKRLLEEKDDEIARLKQLLESKEPVSSIDFKSEEKEQELALPNVFAKVASTLRDLKTDLNNDINKLKNV